MEKDRNQNEIVPVKKVKKIEKKKGREK